MKKITVGETYKLTNGEEIRIERVYNNQCIGLCYYSEDGVAYDSKGIRLSPTRGSPDIDLSEDEPVTILRSNLQHLISLGLSMCNQNSSFAQGWRDIEKALEEGKQITIKD